jgi:hypothetical protein
LGKFVHRATSPIDFIIEAVGTLSAQFETVDPWELQENSPFSDTVLPHWSRPEESTWR